MKKQGRIHHSTPKKRRAANQQSTATAGFIARLPIISCVAGNKIFKTGIGNAMIGRRYPDGSIMVGMFLVDAYCLGIKNAAVMKMPRTEFEHILKKDNPAETMEDIAPCCLKKMVLQSVEYAASLGLAAHKDYKKAAALLEDIDCAACETSYEFGHNGKPFYIAGPNDTPARIRQIHETLLKHCGEGGFDYISAVEGLDEEEIEVAVDSLFIDNPFEAEDLLDQMDEALPFQAQILPDIFSQMRAANEWMREVAPNVRVVDVSYSGDGGGILCELEFDKDVGPHVMQISLTQLITDKRLEFHKEVVKYQKRRVANLKKHGLHGSSSFDADLEPN